LYVTIKKIKPLSSIQHRTMKTNAGTEVQINIFLPSALEDVEWSVSRSGSFTPGETDPGAHCIGGWVGPRAALDVVDKRKISYLCHE
jgi:hypothetical protein